MESRVYFTLLYGEKANRPFISARSIIAGLSSTGSGGGERGGEEDYLSLFLSFFLFRTQTPSRRSSIGRFFLPYRFGTGARQSPVAAYLASIAPPPPLQRTHEGCAAVRQRRDARGGERYRALSFPFSPRRVSRRLIKTGYFVKLICG